MNEQQEGSQFVERRTPGAGSAPFRPEVRSVAAFKNLSPPLQEAFQPADEAEGIHLRHFIEVIQRHKWLIVTGAVVCTLLTAAITKFIDPRYESTVRINVERRGNNGIVGQQAGSPGTGFDVDTVLTTQMQIVQSDPVLRPATEQFHLLDLEEQFKGLKPDEASRLRTAPIKLKRLKVAREDNTYLINISYQATDPQLAANVANTIGATYVKHAFDSRDRSYLQVSAAIDRQLKDLHARMVASGEALTKFNQQLSIIDPEQRVSILSARLLQLDTDYTSAQSDRLRKEAILDATKSGKLAAAQVSTHAENLEHLIEALNSARQEFAVVRTTYAENHPEYKRVNNKLTELENQFQELRTNTMQRVQEDYNQARSREDMARQLVAETKDEVDHMNLKAVQYQQLKDEAESYRKLYEDLQKVTGEEDINRSFQDAVIQIEEPARAAAKHVFPIMWLNLLVAAVVSAIGGIAGVLVYDSLDTKVHTAEDAARLPNVEVIASLPKLKKAREIGSSPRSGTLVGKLAKSKRTKMLMQYYESIRALRNSVDFTEMEVPLRSLLITSSCAGEGKSTIASNLAFSYALLGKKVLLIDADMRRPSLHEFFEKKPVQGLAELLEGKADWNTLLIKVAREHMFLLSAGTMSDRSSDLAAPGVSELLQQAYEQFDLVILDGPPLLGAPEAAQLAAVATGVLVVSRAGFSTKNKITEAYSLLKRARARIVGMVMDEVTEGGMEDYSQKVPLALPQIPETAG